MTLTVCFWNMPILRPMLMFKGEIILLFNAQSTIYEADTVWKSLDSWREGGREREREEAGEFLDLNVTPTAQDHLKMTERGRSL